MNRLTSFAVIIFLLIIPCDTSRAETEVSGAVSGEWTLEGNPYIIVDSTWVPEGDSLILLNGTDLQFTENQGLYIFGIFETHGNDGFEDDSVRIHVANGVEHWLGLRFYGENRTVFNYTWIVCPDTAIFLDENYSVTMNDCKIEADVLSFEGFHYNQRVGWDLNFSECDITGGMYLFMEGGRLTAEQCNFDFSSGLPTLFNSHGFVGRGNGYRIIDCLVLDGGLTGAQEGGFCVGFWFEEEEEEAAPEGEA